MPHFLANADYEEKDPEPLHLQIGDEVSLGRTDSAWPGWVWAKNTHGCDGYVPLAWLEPINDQNYRATQAFNATVLTIQRGDELESLEQINGWHWCRNTKNQHGWVAGYLLKPLH